MLASSTSVYLCNIYTKTINSIPFSTNNFTPGSAQCDPSRCGLGPRLSSHFGCERSHFGVKHVACWHLDGSRAYDAGISLTFPVLRSQQVADLSTQPDAHRATSSKRFRDRIPPKLQFKPFI